MFSKNLFKTLKENVDYNEINKFLIKDNDK